MVKHFTLRRLVLSAALCFSCLLANAYDFEVEGIYYNITDSASLTVEVTFSTAEGNSYSGDVTIPETIMYEGTSYSVTSIGDGAFFYCTDLTNVVIGDSLKSIGNGAFSDCTSLKGISLPDALTSIEYGAFENCTSLASVSIGDSLKSIESYAFYNCSSLNGISLPGALTSIGSYAFYNCTSLTSIIIPDGVTSINDYTFYYCSSLMSVILPDALTSIGYSAFRGCSLTDIYSLNPTPPSGTSAFGSYYTTSGRYVYTDATLHVPLEAIVTYATKSPWKSFQRILGDADTLTTNSYVYDFSVNNIYYNVISDETLEVEVTRGAQAYNSYSGEVIIPSTVSHAGKTYTVKSIGACAFAMCDDLESITMPDSLTSIGSYAFYGCTNLTSLVIPDVVTSMDSCTFYDCTSLASVSLPDALTSIGSYAFYGCTSLASIVIPDAVTSIGNGAFRGDSCLTSLSIPVSASYTTYKTSGTYFPFENTIITDLTITGEGDMMDYAFYKATALHNLTIGDGVTSIGSYAFYNCTSLTSIIIPDAVTSIGNRAFRGDSCLASLSIPVSASYTTYYTSITYFPFENTIITDLTITGEGDMMDYAFYKATALQNLTIGDGVTSIGSHAFNGCTSLADIYSLNTTPPTCANTYCFSNYDATLHVPTDAVDTYAATDVWKEFNTIVGDAETAGISAVNVDNDNYKVSADGGMVNVTGLDNGERVTVYTADGRMVGTMTADGGSASISTPKGVAIVRIGNKTLRVAVR